MERKAKVEGLHCIDWTLDRIEMALRLRVGLLELGRRTFVRFLCFVIDLFTVLSMGVYVLLFGGYF